LASTASGIESRSRVNAAGKSSTKAAIEKIADQTRLVFSMMTQ
jgi:hypothetical protein